jgi:hypothetical protein
MMTPIKCFLVERIPDDRECRWRRTDTGETFAHPGQFPIGAIWDAPWMVTGDGYDRKGGFALGGLNEQDGRWLVVRLPNDHDWCIDSRARNCTLPNDNDHRCWIRHGEPPNITVDKVGKTCAAGGGSIQAGDFHGFLRNGEITT